MRLRNVMVVLAAAVTVLLGLPTGAHAADANELTVQITGDENGAPVVTLANGGPQPCQVVSSATGTITLTRVEQDGTLVAPIPIIPNFDDDLGAQLSQRLVTLAPGASVDLRLDMYAVGPTGHALRTVSWSPLATIGALHPVDPTKPITLDLTYASPISVTSGPPLCAPIQASGVSTVTGEDSRSLPWVAVAAAAGVLLLVLLVTLLLMRRRHGRKAGGGTPGATAGGAPTGAVAASVVVLLTAGILVVGWRPAPAHATITPSSEVASAFAACLASMRAPGGDPRNILPTLENPSVNVTIMLDTSGNNGENRLGRNNIFVYWNPNDRRPFSGDNVPREPCDSLYHELYHAFEDTTPQGVDLHECITAGEVHTGISIKEVNATKAENARRSNFGRAQRTKYGPNTLPPGECRPPRPDDPLCHPSRGCPKPPQKPAQSHSDPHLMTFDQRRYSFQAMGEFVAARDAAASDPTSALQIQTRHQPLRQNRLVTRNTAVAANVAGDRVEVRLLDGTLGLLVNGASQPLAATSLPKGGAVSVTPRRAGDMVTIDWPDTSYALVAKYRESLTLIVVPAPGHEGTLSGLLGDNDGDPANDLTTSGAPHEPPTHDDLYPAYADSMRITQQASLFTYEAGTNTDSYTDRTFPDRAPEHLPNQDWAESLCRQFGVTDPVSLTECVTDVANTGSADFLAANVVAQSVAASFRVGGSGATLGIGAPGEVSTVSFAGTAGEKLYVDVVSSTLPDACGVLTLRDPAGAQLATGCVINGRGGIDAVTLPVTGTYTVTVDPPGAATGEIALQLLTPTDQQSELAMDGAEATISITTAGAVGRLTFAGTAGQIVFVDIPTSTLTDACGILAIRDPANKEIAGGCVINGKGHIDRTELAATGTYTIEVDPAGTATGVAHLRLIQVTDDVATIGPDGPEVTATVARAGAEARLSFTGSPGQIVFVDVVSSTLKDECGVTTIRDPLGKTLATGCVINAKGYVDRTVLPQAGTYTIVIDPNAANIGASRLRLVQAVDQQGTITIGGPSVSATVAQPGAQARFTFTGTAGQQVILDVPSSTLNNQCGVLSLLDAAGKELTSGCVINNKGGINSFTLPSTGAYAVVVDPSGSWTGQATLRLHT